MNVGSRIFKRALSYGEIAEPNSSPSQGTYGETLCSMRDPDGYIIEVGQSKPEVRYG
jgi:hypothetical protein